MNASFASASGSGANRPSTISKAVNPLLIDLVEAVKTNFTSPLATNNATGPKTYQRLTGNDLALLRRTVTPLARIFDNATTSTKLPTFVFGIVTGLRVRPIPSTGQYVLKFIITDPSMPITGRHDAVVIKNCVRYVQLYLTKPNYAQFGFSRDAAGKYNCMGSVIVLCRPVLNADTYSNYTQLFMANEMARMMLADLSNAEKLEKLGQMVCPVNNPALQACYVQNFRGSSVFFGHARLAINAKEFGVVHALYCAALLRWWHHILPEKISNCGNNKTLCGGGANKLLLDFALKAKPELAASVDEKLYVKTYLAARKETSATSTKTLSAAERAGIQACIRDAKLALVEHATYRMRVVVRGVGVIKMDGFLGIGHVNKVGRKTKGARSDGSSRLAQQQSRLTISHLTITSLDSNSTNRNYTDALSPSNSRLPAYNSAQSGAYVWCIYVQRLPEFESPDNDNKPTRQRKKVDASEAGACAKLKSFVEIKKSSVPVPSDVMLEMDRDGELIPILILPNERQYQMFFGALLDGPRPVGANKMGQIRVARFYRIMSLFHYLIQLKFALTIDFELQSYKSVRYNLMQGYWGKFYQSLKQENLPLQPGPSSRVLPVVQRADVPTSEKIAEKESRGQQPPKESTQQLPAVNVPPLLPPLPTPLPPQCKQQPPTASFIERPLPRGGLPMKELRLLKCSKWLPGLDYVVDLDDFEKYRTQVWCRKTPDDEERMSVDDFDGDKHDVRNDAEDLHADDQPEERMSVDDLAGVGVGHNNVAAGVADRDALDDDDDEYFSFEDCEEENVGDYDVDDDDASEVASSSISVAVPPGEVATADYASKPG